jgi:multidrug efflux pump subunit AcrA (membrane-fusion protein)
MIRPAVLALALLSLPQDKVEPAEELHVVRKGNLVPSCELEGTFEAEESAEFRVRTEAYSGEAVLARVLPAGAAARKGDEVLALDPVPLRRQIAAAENELRLARATLAKAQADLELGAHSDALAHARAEAEAQDAETNLRVFETVEGKHLVEQAELNVRMNKDRLKDQEEELDQLRKMYKSEELTNATAEIVVRRAERAIDQTKVFLRMAEESSGVTKAVKHPQQKRQLQAAVDQAKAALASLKAAQALSRTQREVEHAKAQAAVEQQDDQLAKLRRDLEGFTFRAPFDGRVYYGEYQQGQWPTAEQTAKTLRPGEKLQPGQALVTVCGARTRVRGELGEAEYLELAVGQAVEVRPAALPGAKPAGAVREKTAVAVQKPTGAAFPALIELKEPRTDLLPGMKAKVMLTGKELKDVLVVPSGAVAGAEGKHTVKVSKNGKSEAREVEVGKTDGKLVEIRSGLEAGEKVVVEK